jgi:hypothetical protein
MNKSKAIKIAIAFKRGAAFIRGMRQLAQDADVPEGTRWITIGAAEGDDGKKHGGRDFSQDYETQKKIMDMLSKELKDYTDGRIKFAKDVVDWVKSKGKTKRG